jgi:hypothetical protein
MVCVNLFKFVGEIVEVHQILQQQAEFPPLNESVAAAVCCFVRTHKSRFAVERREHLDDPFVYLCQREAAVAVDI